MLKAEGVEGVVVRPWSRLDDSNELFQYAYICVSCFAICRNRRVWAEAFSLSPVSQSAALIAQRRACWGCFYCTGSPMVVVQI